MAIAKESKPVSGERRLRVLVVGCGNMGRSHALAYHRLPDCEVVGLVSRGAASREALAPEVGNPGLFADYGEALAATAPDVVCVATYTETHVPYTLQALDAGAHVFVEKPLAETVEGAEQIRRRAAETGGKVVVGYILRHHPSWARFIETARTLGKPLVMRMNLNQQSSGDAWLTHRNLMRSLSPMVDCGVHYVDVMCQMTQSEPIRVQAMEARLDPSLPEGRCNYGQLQVCFADGSVGWYEAGWGPMMSEEAYFIKDVIGPRGSATISKREGGDSGSVAGHTVTDRIRLHHAELDGEGRFARADEWIDTSDEPGHDELCRREQEAFIRAIRDDLSVDRALDDAVNSLRIVLAADQSAREGRVVDL